MIDASPLVAFPPVIEPKSVKNAFISENPWKHKSVNNVPYIIGFNKKEGDAFMISMYFESRCFTFLIKCCD